MTTSLTEGEPKKVLLRFSLPMLLSVVFQQFYNITDSIIAGKFIGPNALAAVGASYPVTTIFLAFATGLSIGSTVIISKLFGGERLKEVGDASKTALITMAATAVILTLIGLLGYKWIITALKTPSDIFDDSCLYLKIYIYGIFFLLIYNGSNAVFMSLGDSKTPLMFLIASSIGNIILDIIFVACLRLGVAGVAWATFIAQGFASAAAVFAVFIRMKKVIKSEQRAVFSFTILKQILYISIPSTFQNAFISIGNMLIQGLVNSFGPDVIAGYAAAVKLNTFAITCFSTMSNSISSYVAQNIGAGKIDRVIKGIKTASIMSFVLCLPFILIYFIFSNQMIGLFLNESNENIIYVGIMFLKIASPFYLAASFKIVIDGSLRGLGIMSAFTISTVSDYLIRIIFAYILAGVLGSSTGIWLAWPVSWLAGTLISYLFYIKAKKTLKTKI